MIRLFIDLICFACAIFGFKFLDSSNFLLTFSHQRREFSAKFFFVGGQNYLVSLRVEKYWEFFARFNLPFKVGHSEKIGGAVNLLQHFPRFRGNILAVEEVVKARKLSQVQFFFHYEIAH